MFDSLWCTTLSDIFAACVLAVRVCNLLRYTIYIYIYTHERWENMAFGTIKTFSSTEKFYVMRDVHVVVSVKTEPREKIQTQTQVLL